jgi:hypothetical protein
MTTLPDYGTLTDREIGGLRDKVAGLAKSFASTGGFDAETAMLASQKLRSMRGSLDPKRRKKAEAAGAALESRPRPTPRPGDAVSTFENPGRTHQRCATATLICPTSRRHGKSWR